MADLMKPPRAFKEQQLNKSKGVLDDHAVRKSMLTREGSITKTPSADIDIVNKKYVDGQNLWEDNAATTNIQLKQLIILIFKIDFFILILLRPWDWWQLEEACRWA